MWLDFRLLKKNLSGTPKRRNVIMVPQLCLGRNVIMVLLNCTKMTFLQNRNEPHVLKSTPLWLFSGPEMNHLCDFSLFFSNLHHNDFSPRPKLRHHYDFSHFLGSKLQGQFLGWKNAQIPQLIDADGRALHKDSESGPYSKITKITDMTFLQNTAVVPEEETGKFTSITHF